MGKTRQELKDLAENFNIIDNNAQEIDPVEVRNQYTNERDSTLNKVDDGIEPLEVASGKSLKYSTPPNLSELDDDGLTTKSHSQELSNGAIITHVSEPDPHPQYLDNAKGDNRYYTKLEIDTQQNTQDSNISNNASNIGNNATQIGNNTTQIGNNNTQISNNITQIGNNTTQINTNTTDISNNAVNIGANSLNIANNLNSINTNSTDITTNVNNISSNQLDISDNSTDISNNTTSISNNAINISNNSTDIVTNQNDISSLETSQSVQDLEIALNTAKVSADESVNTHSDVDLTGLTVFQNSILKYDGSNYVPCLGVLIDAPTLIINNANVMVDVVNTNIDIQRLNPYKITISYGWSLNDARQDFETFATFGGQNISKGLSNNNPIHIQEPKDVGGSDPDGRGTNQVHRFTGVFIVVPTSLGNNNLILEMSGSANGDLASIWDVKIEIEEYINVNNL